MRNSVSIIVCAVIWVLVSCSPKVTSNVIHTYPAQESLENVAMFMEKEQLPADAEWMGSIDVKGKADYDRLAEITRFNAWQDGGKYVRIKEFASQGARSNVNIMRSDVYRADTTEYVSVAMPIMGSDRTDSESINQSVRSIYSSPLQPVSDSPVDHTFSFSDKNSLRAFVGYGQRLNKMNPELNNFEKRHLKKMMKGVLLGADYVRYFNSSRTCGFGLRYQIMHGSSKNHATVTFEDGSPSLEGLLDDYVNISYFGPIYSQRFVTSNGKNCFMYNAGLGLLSYKGKSKIAGKTCTTSGTTSGVTLDFNYSHMLSDKLSLGADLSFTSGTLTNYTIKSYYGETITVSGDDKDLWEGLLQMGICAQLLYTF